MHTLKTQKTAPMLSNRRVLMATARATFCLMIALAYLGFASGCASDGAYIVNVQGSIPEPLVDPLPITIAVHYSPEFSDYTSAQESLNGNKWRIAFADMQKTYFHTMMSSAFDKVIISPTATPEPGASYTALIVPRVANFSFLTPSESGSKFFAVSMRHFVTFIGPDGHDYGAWEIHSYGRSRSTFGRGIEDLATEACLDAMRDLASSIVVGVPEEIFSRNIVNPDTIASNGGGS